MVSFAILDVVLKLLDEAVSRRGGGRGRPWFLRVLVWKRVKTWFWSGSREGLPRIIAWVFLPCTIKRFESPSEFGSAWTYLSFQSQMNKKERAICKFEINFKKSFCWRSNLMNVTKGREGGGSLLYRPYRCRPQGYSFCAVIWVWKLV